MEYLSKPVTYNTSYMVTREFIRCSQNGRPLQKRARSLTAPVNSHVDNVQVKNAPDLNQPLFQFINAVDVWQTRSCMVVCPTVQWIEVWAVHRP